MGRLAFASGCLAFACVASVTPRAFGQAASTSPTDTPSTTATERQLPPGVREGTAIGGATEAWNPAWQYRVGVHDYVITGAAIATAVGASILEPGDPSQTSKRWKVDEDVRDALRLPSTVGRYHIRDASDVTVSLLTTWPILIDSLVTSWWYRGNSTVAFNIAVVDAEVIAVVAAAQRVTTGLVGRERPFVRNCESEQLRDAADCERQVRNRSFFSGHSSQAFASAGALCVNHLGMRLLKAPGDWITCAAAITFAAATGTFRIMGDMHYASDVLTGALVGTAVGVGLPLLHGYNVKTGTTTGLKLKVMPVGLGVGLGGTF